MCALKRDRPQTLTRDDAETVALQALAFLAEEPKRLGRFLALTGYQPAELAEAATTGAVQSAVLDYLLSDESLLLVFSSSAGLRPEAVLSARALLDGPAGGWRN
ncbi:MAG: DUF3572 domain-containing protein [Deltaproteobacteria bacterium]